VVASVEGTPSTVNCTLAPASAAPAGVLTTPVTAMPALTANAPPLPGFHIFVVGANPPPGTISTSCVTLARRAV